MGIINIRDNNDLLFMHKNILFKWQYLTLLRREPGGRTRRQARSRCSAPVFREGEVGLVRANLSFPCTYTTSSQWGHRLCVKKPPGSGSSACTLCLCDSYVTNVATCDSDSSPLT